jgi:hypothetical protein
VGHLKVAARGIDFSLRPRRVKDVGNPVWIDIDLKVDGPDLAPLVASGIVMTTSDLADVLKYARTAAHGSVDCQRIASTDESVIIEFARALSPTDVEVTIFVGEPYGLMNGRRFSVPKDAVAEFATELSAELVDLGIHI